MSDFKALVEEMKEFYGVSSLEAVAEKMGYGKNIAMGWRRNKKLSAHAQLKWLEAKGELGEITENFDELTREMQAFYGVSSLEAVAEKMGYHPHNAIKWRKNNKLTPHAQLKWLEAKQQQGESETMSIDELNAAKQALGVQTDKELAEALGVERSSINNYRVRGIPQKLRALIAEKRLEQQQQKDEEGGEMSDFKGLVEEMKEFYGVNSLEAVAEKMGYEKNTAIGWRNNKKLSARAQIKWLEAKNGGSDEAKNFDKLVEEMKEFYGVNSLDVIAEKLGYERTNAAVWRKNKKLSARAMLKWLEIKNEEKNHKEEVKMNTQNEKQALIGNTERTLFVPLLSLKASAGYGIENFEQRQEGGIYLDIKLFKVMPNAKHLCGMQVSGDSMSPTLRNGDYVVVDTSQKGGRDGIYVLLVGSELLIKRLQFELDGGIEILSDNPLYKSKHYDANETQQYLEIVGRVVYEAREL